MDRFTIDYKLRPGIRDVKVLGLLRLRNESLILEDTLAHFSQFVDGIVCLDDCSEDESVTILEQNRSVLAIIRNAKWLTERLTEETLHRQVLLEIGREYAPQWMFYSDCDERFIGDIAAFLTSTESQGVDGVRISLFDAYMTQDDQRPYQRGKPLLNFRKYFGPERRDILMIWKNSPEVRFVGLDAREPSVPGHIITKFYCQHYGKALSHEHWEATCQYYVEFFPDPYKTKWLARKGKAIHLSSDFNRPLYFWWDVVAVANAI
jgi:hypothetical protein